MNLDSLPDKFILLMEAGRRSLRRQRQQRQEYRERRGTPNTDTRDVNR